jgi:hypothetical protein
MKAFIIAFAAVLTAAYAPQTGPFKRLLEPPPTVPHEDPVTDAALDREGPCPPPTATPSEKTAKRRGHADRPRGFLKRWQARTNRDSVDRRSPSKRSQLNMRPRRRERRSTQPPGNTDAAP